MTPLFCVKLWTVQPLCFLSKPCQRPANHTATFTEVPPPDQSCRKGKEFQRHMEFMTSSQSRDTPERSIMSGTRRITCPGCLKLHWSDLDPGSHIRMVIGVAFEDDVRPTSQGTDHSIDGESEACLKIYTEDPIHSQSTGSLFLFKINKKGRCWVSPGP